MNEGTAASWVKLQWSGTGAAFTNCTSRWGGVSDIDWQIVTANCCEVYKYLFYLLLSNVFVHFKSLHWPCDKITLPKGQLFCTLYSFQWVLRDLVTKTMGVFHACSEYSPAFLKYTLVLDGIDGLIRCSLVGQDELGVYSGPILNTGFKREPCKRWIISEVHNQAAARQWWEPWGHQQQQ